MLIYTSSFIAAIDLISLQKGCGINLTVPLGVRLMDAL